jgi:hypothetical protein
VIWEDGSRQDGMKEEWFTRDEPKKTAKKSKEGTSFLDALVKKKGIDSMDQ